MLLEAAKIILKELRSVTDEEAEKFLKLNGVETYFKNKEDLIKGMAV